MQRPAALAGAAAGWTRRIARWRFARYGLASALGTAADIGAFLLLLSGGVAAAWSAAFGYALGTLVHWIVTSRIVFHDRLARPGWQRGGQQVLFLASALVGLAITSAVVGGGTAAGYDPRLAKLAAMGISFLTVWLLRLVVVFRTRT